MKSLYIKDYNQYGSAKTYARDRYMMFDRFDGKQFKMNFKRSWRTWIEETSGKKV